MQILAVDDDNFHLKVLEHALAQLGHTPVLATGGDQALTILRRGEIHLVITDWEMPGMNGVDLCRILRQEDFNGYVYLIMLTGREGKKCRHEGLAAGADAFLNKPLDIDELDVCLKTAERILSLETRDVALFALAKLAESRDPEIGGHIERVQSYTRLLAQHLSPRAKEMHGVDAEYIRLLYQTSPLHDLGKVGVPDGVLLKPGKLTAEEFEIMKTHTSLGSQTLDAALQRFPNVRFLQIARDVAASHHERFDGTGYPAFLAGEQIPFCGRIVAVADVYDALTSRRVYKEAMTHEKAYETICRERGTHFDPDVLDAFIDAEKEIIAVQARLRDEVQLPESVEMPVAVEQVSLPQQRPCGILVVEDSPTIQKMLVRLLAGIGQPVFSASNAGEAMEIFTTQLPGLIVSDLEMPGASGIELCCRIRARAAAEPVHFIMLTSRSDQNSMLEAYKAGVDDFVTKPFNSDELIARVRAGLRTCRLHEELTRKTSRLQAVNIRLTQMNGRLDRLSITDELTGLFNRRHAMVRLEEQWALAERYRRLLTVGLVDVDRFKKINDTYGHDAGDLVLRRVAGILRDQTRGTDAVCRIGGEEFLIIFPSETMEEAIACCQRCRAAVEAHTFRVGDANIAVTISVGVAMRSQNTLQFPDLLREADKALYAAKNTGRNRVCTAEHNCEESNMSISNAVDAQKAQRPIPSGDAQVDWQQVIHRCGGDASFALAVARRFAVQAPAELAQIEESLAKGDVDTLRRSAHSLKSMAAYISAAAIATTCKKIEDLARDSRLAEIPPMLPELREQTKRATDWIARNATPQQAISA
jgi:putative two-component system response regulator